MTVRDAFMTNFRRIFNDRVTKDADMDVTRFARKAGVSKKNIYLWLNGDTTPTLVNAYRLAKALKCDVNDFLKGANE